MAKPKGKKKVVIKNHATGWQKSRAKGRITHNFNGYKTLGKRRSRKR